eukprot:8401721-Heterocapsa_arctica.AAC.1
MGSQRRGEGSRVGGSMTANWPTRNAVIRPMAASSAFRKASETEMRVDRKRWHLQAERVFSTA